MSNMSNMSNMLCNMCKYSGRIKAKCRWKGMVLPCRLASAHGEREAENTM